MSLMSKVFCKRCKKIVGKDCKCKTADPIDPALSFVLRRKRIPAHHPYIGTQKREVAP